EPDRLSGTERFVELLAGPPVDSVIVDLNTLAFADYRALAWVEHLGPGLVDRPGRVDLDLRCLIEATGDLYLVEVVRGLDRLELRGLRGRGCGCTRRRRGRSGRARRGCGRRLRRLVLAAPEEQQQR